MSCPHGMPAAGSCIDCMDEGLLPPAPKPEPARPLGHMTVARFPGHCAGCNLAIHEGQTIAAMSDDTWRHSACVEWAP